jgi:sulfite reductase alpha subunit-like flavoprotein
LGNKSFENFCGMGVKIDGFLQNIGAKRVFPMGKGKIKYLNSRRC